MRLIPLGEGASPLGPVPQLRRRSDGEPIGDMPLSGSWAATRWQYESRARPGRVVDVVTDLGGSVTLSLSDGTWVLTWAVPGRGSRTVGGTLVVEGHRLDLVSAGASAAQSIQFSLAPETLALNSEGSAWAFDEGGEEPADFVAVLVRL